MKIPSELATRRAQTQDYNPTSREHVPRTPKRLAPNGLITAANSVGQKHKLPLFVLTTYLYWIRNVRSLNGDACLIVFSVNLRFSAVCFTRSIQGLRALLSGVIDLAGENLEMW